MRTRFSSAYLCLICISTPLLTISSVDAKPRPAVHKQDSAVAAAPKADPDAYALLKGAYENREAFGKDFAGLNSDITVDDNGTQWRGQLAFKPGSGVKVTLPGAPEELARWAQGQASNSLGHRVGGDFAHGDGSNPITFTTDDHSPLGRQVALNDGLNSFYRVKDRTITEVTRTMGDTRFTITVMETMTARNGKYLPLQFAVTYFDAKTGAIQQLEMYSDTYSRVSNEWVPNSRRVVTAEKGAFTTRSLALQNVHLLKNTTTARK